LVAVINNAEDFQRASVDGWYRIPQRRAPRRIGADYLAFYQTAAFRQQGEAQCVTWFAPTRRYKLARRNELLPDEPDHPRATEYYYQIAIGPLQRLERPIPSHSLKRVTFIHTTMAHLMSAEDVVDLFVKDDPFENLWDALRAHQLRPLKNRIVCERPVDITLRARLGALGVYCTEELTAQEARQLPVAERWEMLRLSTQQISQDLDGCLRRIGGALLRLGGSVISE
jgi:hypothetical protein